MPCCSGNQGLSQPVGGLERQMLPGPLLVSWNKWKQVPFLRHMANWPPHKQFCWLECGAILAWMTFCFRNKLQNGASAPLTAREGIRVCQFGGLNLLLKGCFCTLPAVGREGNLGEATSTPQFLPESLWILGMLVCRYICLCVYMPACVFPVFLDAARKSLLFFGEFRGHNTWKKGMRQCSSKWPVKYANPYQVNPSRSFLCGGSDDLPGIITHENFLPFPSLSLSGEPNKSAPVMSLRS